MVARTWAGRLTLTAVAAAAWAATTVCLAQTIIVNGNQRIVLRGAGSAEAAIPGQNVFVPPDRTLLQRLANAERLLEGERYDEAVRLLGAILDEREDYFFQADRGAVTQRSLKMEVQRLIGAMPPEGLALYELQFGARARQKLADALARGDQNALTEVGRQYLHTQAGYEATLLLGLDHLDHARPWAGALVLQRLRQIAADTSPFEPTLSLALATCWLQAGMPEKAQEVLCELRAQHGGTPIEVAGKAIDWFDDDTKAVAWLAELVGASGHGRLTEPDSWLMFGGDPSRNASAPGGVPLLNVRWRIPATDEPVLQARLREQYRARADRGQPALSPMQPLAVGDVVLMRTVRGLLAVDFVSGRRLWETPADDPIARISNGSANVGRGGSVVTVDSSTLMAERRLSEDATYGTLSSDGRCVFAVEDLSLTPISTQATRVIVVNGQAVPQPAPTAFNRLAAYDVRTGTLRWQVGGPSGENALALAETFFLGPPLPLAERLYVLGESKGEIRLFVLEADTGDLAWTQQLAMVEGDILQESYRQLAGASPSYADGVLVCPTCSGAVVGVDVATRSLLWGYRYDRDPNLRNSSQIVLVQAGGSYLVSQTTDRRFDATAVLASGRVLVAPVDSRILHCLNLIDGEQLWTMDRSSNELLACVYEDNVVLAGPGRVRAVSLSETNPQPAPAAVASLGEGESVIMGPAAAESTANAQTVSRPKSAWRGRSVPLPEGSLPSGRGFLTGYRYYLPLSSAAVAVIDVAEGKVVEVVKSRAGNVPGNLVCCQDKVISQGVDGLEVFSQLGAVRQEVDRRLGVNRDDPVGLLLQGEVLLEEGKRAEAVVALRRSHDLDSNPGAGALLCDVLLEGLQKEFATYRDRADEIGGLLDGPEQRMTYLRLMAVGLQDAREWSPALDHYMQLVDASGDELPMQRVSDDLTVRLDRWIRYRLAALRRDAGGELESFDRAVDMQLQAAVEAGGIGPLARFLDYFGDLPVAAKARGELARRLKDSERWIDAELLLWPQQASADPAVAGPAVAELADLYRRAKSPDAAAWCYGRLGEEYAEVVCSDGKTGRELVDALPEEDRLGQRLTAARQWPVGQIESKTATMSASSSYRRTLPYQDSPGPFFADVDIQYDQSRNLIVALDTFGRERWKYSLAQSSGGRVSFNVSLAHVRTCGHLVLVSLGTGIIALDTLATPGTSQPALLWSRGSGSPSLDPFGSDVVFVGGGVINLQTIVGASGAQINRLGPVDAGFTCYQQDRDLVAIDSVSGDVLWVRHGLAANSTLFGDGEVVLAVAPGQSKAQVFRASDGDLLGSCDVPPVVQTIARSAIYNGSVSSSAQTPRRNSTIATFGRRVLTWNPAAGSDAVVQLVDPWEKREVWSSRRFSRGVKYDIVGQEALALWEPDGRFTLLDLADGRTIADVNLGTDKNMAFLSVLPWEDGYLILAAESLPASTPGRSMQAVPNALSLPVGSARVYLLGRDGHLTWPEPVPIKDQYYVIDQPVGLPVLTFACLTRDTSGATNRSPTNDIAVQCVDKRTGRVVYEGRSQYRSSSCQITGDPEKQTVSLQISGQKITLTLTDRPVPPDDAQAEKPAEKVSASGEAPPTSQTPAADPWAGMDLPRTMSSPPPPPPAPRR